MLTPEQFAAFDKAYPYCYRADREAKAFLYGFDYISEATFTLYVQYKNTHVVAGMLAQCVGGIHKELHRMEQFFNTPILEAFCNQSVRHRLKKKTPPGEEESK